MDQRIIKSGRIRPLSTCRQSREGKCCFLAFSSAVRSCSGGHGGQDVGGHTSQINEDIDLFGHLLPSVLSCGTGDPRIGSLPLFHGGGAACVCVDFLLKCAHACVSTFTTACQPVTWMSKLQRTWKRTPLLIE